MYFSQYFSPFSFPLSFDFAEMDISLAFARNGVFANWNNERVRSLSGCYSSQIHEPVDLVVSQKMAAEFARSCEMFRHERICGKETKKTEDTLTNVMTDSC